MGQGLVTIKVFTRPTCTSCKAAILMSQDTARQHRRVSVEVASPASLTGRPEAYKSGILSVPTILIRSKYRFTGVPRREELVLKLEAAMLEAEA